MRVPRRAVLVLGMHRSGTSAVTRCLNLLGVDLGKMLLPPKKNNNPKGFWESMVAVGIHEKLLANLDRSWNDARPLPEGWLASGAAREAREQIAGLIRDEFGNHQLWAVKDPRLCRFVPLWRAVLEEQGIDVSALLVVRHPQEVAQSLLDRDGLPMELAWLIWLQHFAEAESTTRGLPRTIVGYDELLSNWKGELTKAGHDLAITWPVSITDASAAIDSFLDRDARHHEATTAHEGMPEVLARLYRLCVSRESEGAKWGDISRVIDSYLELAPAFQGRAELLVDRIRVAKQQGMDMEREAEDSLAILEEITSRIKATRRKRESQEDRATLYWRAGGAEFSETCACTVSARWEVSSEAKLRFELPPDLGVAALRFDPSVQSGAFNLSALRLNGVAVENLRDSVLRVNQHMLDRQAGNGIWFASDDGDPWIEFDVSGLASPGAPLVVEISCARRSLDNVMAALMASISGEMEHRIRSDIASSVSSIARQLSGTADQLVAMQVAGLALLPDRGPRLYYRRVGNAFSREGSVTGILVGLDDTATLDFVLPIGTIDYLRFDLAAVAGCYRVGPVVINGGEVENLSRRVMKVHGRRLRDPDSGAEIRLVEWGSAPSFEMDVRDLFGERDDAGQAAVRVTVRKEHSAVETERQLDAAVAEVSRQLEEHGKTVRSAINEVGASLSLAQQSAYQRIHGDVLKVDAHMDRLGVETSQTLAGLAAQAENLGHEVAALRQNLDAARGQLDFLTHYELNRSFVRRALRRLRRTFWK